MLIGVPTPRDVDRLRAAGNVHLDLWEELAAIPTLEAAWGQAMFGNRLGPHPLAIAATTPRTRPFLRRLLDLPTTVITHGRMRDNPHIADDVKHALEAQYAGTRIGRQELDGELLDDVDGALWSPAMMDTACEGWRVEVARWAPSVPSFTQVVVAVDPPASETGAECGIVAAGVMADGRVVVLQDHSVPHATPDQWARAAVEAYTHHTADRVVVEVNQGGEMAVHTLRTVYPNLPITKVHASRGKVTRAEPVVALYEQGRVMHAERFPVLEDQLTTWTVGAPSPDRLDALVWAVTELRGGSAGRARVFVPRGRIPTPGDQDRPGGLMRRGPLRGW